MVVVYKIDRLTRSLTDFARIVEVFDTNDVSFVSVTQQFNTTTSMGRLTLNVLLSFAQFEREVTAERIRDKIAASKKKGMWMSGLSPIGFEVEDKKLVVNIAEAETVRTLFNLYLKVQNVRQLKIKADELGLKTKCRRTKGVETGGKSFTRGHLYQLLSNPLYDGKIAQKGETYSGQHTAIIDRNTWRAVQQLLSTNAVSRHSSTNSKHPSLLVGLLFDETGDRLSPTHASNDGRRYRYYISHRLMQTARDKNDGWRVPAQELENLVVNRVVQLLSNEQQALDLVTQPSTSSNQLGSALENAGALCNSLGSTNRSAKCELLQAIVERVTITLGQLNIEIDGNRLVVLLTEVKTTRTIESATLTVPFKVRRRGVETKLVIKDNKRPVGGKDPVLIAAVVRGNMWFGEIAAGQTTTIRDIANREAIDEGDVSRMICFAFLAPDIVKAIVDGRQPVQLTAERLKRSGSLPLSWTDQRRLLGFPE